MKSKAAWLGPLQVIGQSSPATRSSPSATPIAPTNIVNANKRTDLRANSFNTVRSRAHFETDLAAEEVDANRVAQAAASSEARRKSYRAPAICAVRTAAGSPQ
jgi:hypothetical protein